MSRLECDSCGDLVDVSWRTTTLPYICQRCTKDSDLAIDRDVWETEYVGPACQQAAEELHGLYIDEEDDIPCDDAPYYIVEARGKFNKSDWFRSENNNTKGVFDDYSTALEAAEREQDGSRIEYRVVECRTGPTSGDTSYNSGVPCQSALDSVQEEQFDIDDPNSDINQFDADTELINGLLAENDDLKMQLSQANLNIQIQGEIIADLENTIHDYRVILRVPGYYWLD